MKSSKMPEFNFFQMYKNFISFKNVPLTFIPATYDRIYGDGIIESNNRHRAII